MALSEVAPGVRRVTTGIGPGSHAYLLEDGDEVIAFDTAIKGSGPEILEAAGGRLTRVVLSHAHPDHRGAAPELGVPVLCHPDEVADAEGDGGAAYTDFDQLTNPPMRQIMRDLREAWDGGPVAIAGTLREGDEVAGFRVLDIPGHAPGQIALFRERDRLLLSADAFYVFDMNTGEEGEARVPPSAVNQDTERARASLRRLVELDAAAAWPSHGRPVVDDVSERLRRAAEA